MNYTFAAISISGFFIAGIAAIAVLSRNYKSLLNWLFFLYAAMVAFFNLTDFLIKITPSAQRAVFFSNLSNTFWLLFLFFFLHFAVVMAVGNRNRLAILTLTGFALTTVFMVSLIWSGEFFYFDPQLTRFGYSPFPGPGYYYAAAYSFFMVLLSAYFFWVARRRSSDQRLRHQSRVLLAGIFVGMFVGVTGDVLMPVFGVFEVTLVPLAAIIFVLFFLYAMVRYGLLAISPGAIAGSVILTMPNILLVIGLDHKISLTNRETREALGFTEKELSGKEMHELIEGEYSKTLCEVLTTEMSQQGFVRGRRLRLKKKDGTSLPVSLDASRAKDAFGNDLGCILIFRDVSNEEALLAQQKEAIEELTKTKERMLSILEDTTEARDRADNATKELAKTYEDLKAVDRMKTEFLSVVSHELRTPITPIKGYASMLISETLGKLSDEQKSAVTVIQKEGDHLLNLIDSILDVSRLSYGRPLELEKQPVLIRTLAEELNDVLQPEAKMRDIDISVGLPPDFPTIMGDPVKLRRLLANLLGNSLKFTPKGGHIKIAGSADQDMVEVSVIDDGIGLAKESLEKIFERFYQVDSSYTRAAGGIGLGLAIAKEIVETHGGRILAESGGLGKGTKISFTLPIGG